MGGEEVGDEEVGSGTLQLRQGWGGGGGGVGWEWMKYCSCTGGGDRVGWEMDEERGVL